MNKETKILLAVAVGTIALLFGGSALFNKAETNPTSQSTKVIDTSILVGENPHSRGVKEAKVVVVEFGDFECPACGLSEPTVKKIVDEYSDRISFVFRHFPLEQHKYAFYAAQASEAASEQGKFWEMHDALYAKQSSWGDNSKAQEVIDSIASEIGLNMDQYKKAMSDKKFDDIINKGVTDGVAAGVNATPTFFINGKKQPSIANYDSWKSLLDSELSTQK